MIEQTGKTYVQAFWEWVRESGLPLLVINGYVYSYETLDTAKASSDKHRYVLMTKPLQVLHIHRILRIGKAPEGMNDTARIITRGKYSWYLERPNIQCRMKGCFDRYNCALYRKENETEPWNEIPEDWVVGNEFCELFTKYI